MDYTSEMDELLASIIPAWFYEMDVEQRNTIMKSALTKYESLTIAKNNQFLFYWADVIKPYQPSNN